MGTAGQAPPGERATREAAQRPDGAGRPLPPAHPARKRRKLVQNLQTEGSRWPGSHRPSRKTKSRRKKPAFTILEGTRTLGPWMKPYSNEEPGWVSGLAIASHGSLAPAIDMSAVRQFATKRQRTELTTDTQGIETGWPGPRLVRAWFMRARPSSAKPDGGVLKKMGQSSRATTSVIVAANFDEHRVFSFNAQKLDRGEFRPGSLR